jgi:WhiB family redox-sensing transcriptional regulator
MDTELFFPLGHGREFTAQVEEAKAVCRGCPVRSECLAAANDRPERYGIFGGLTDDERSRERRNVRRRAAARREEVA